jgi:arginine N-succinyltransferase
MIIIRPVTRKDLPAFAAFSIESMLGMTNLPRDADKLEAKIIHSESCFLRDIQKPGLEEYYFVLEDLSTQRIGGVCGILSQNSLSRSFFYRIEIHANDSKHPNAPKEFKILRAVSNNNHNSEVCSLYLQPTFRHSGLGRLLSLSRFLFMGAHPHRFESNVVVEMRGHIDQNQVSPFWDAVGRHFCNLSFVDLMTQIDNDRTFVPDILPKYPIYVDLLPKEAQEVIGKTHEGSKPALSMLMQEGFLLKNEVDLFDAGPILSASLKDIRTVKSSQLIPITITGDLLKEEPEFIMGNEKMDFRACYGKLRLLSPTEALINQEVAEALNISNGDTIRYVVSHG